MEEERTRGAGGGEGGTTERRLRGQRNGGRKTGKGD